MSQPTRRTFVQLSALTALSSTRVIGANDRINVAIVGLGGRGRYHVGAYAKQPGAHIQAICDVDQASLERGQALANKATGETPKAYKDMKEVFADKDVHAVSLPLPNHWHALAAIWACQAGKDVYVEKPASHDLFEGQQMVAAARKYGRMMQVGSQSRSIAHKIRAVQMLQDGAIGKVYLAKGLCFKRRKSIGHTPVEAVPPGVDWDKFRGPARMVEFTKNQFLYNWHWFWDTGNGDLGNQGVHELDIARWGLGVDFPMAVSSTGGKYVYDDDQETPNTQICRYDYGDKELVFEVRGLQTGIEADLTAERGGNVIGNLFYGSEGWMSLDADGFRVYKGDPAKLVQTEKYQEPTPTDAAPHFTNFLEAVRTRQYKQLHADVDIGRISAGLAHLANISYRLKGQNLVFNPKTEEFANGDAQAMAHSPSRSPYTIPKLA